VDLWWRYPPEYLFPETIDLPPTDSPDDTSTSNWQLATDLLDVPEIQYYLNGEPPPLTPILTTTQNTSATYPVSDQSYPSDTNPIIPDQSRPSGSHSIPSDQPITSEDNEIAQGQSQTPRANQNLLDQSCPSSFADQPPIEDNTPNLIMQMQTSVPTANSQHEPSHSTQNLPKTPWSTNSPTVNPWPLKWQCTPKHKTNENKSQRQIQRLIRQRIVPSFTAVLSAYHNEQTFYSYLLQAQLDATVDTWISPNDSNESTSSDPTSAMIAELDAILQSFPQLQPDDILQHLPSLDPIWFLALDNANDTLTCSQMLWAPDKQEFLQAEETELKGLLDMNVWKYRRISTLPTNARLINSVWSYRRKRTADGHLVKHKARLCADGCQQQQGVDFFESYAPVITWTTIRLVLLLSVLLNLHCRQVDFTQAFPQADIDIPVYLRMPAGWSYTDVQGNSDYWLELTKNLYGTKQAARGWFLHLRDGLIKQGFQQSTIDPCLFFRKDCILVVYTDDCLIFGPSAAQVQAVIRSLQTTFLLKDEGEVKDFLGIRVHRDPNHRTITLTQPGLIDSVLTDLGLLDDTQNPVQHKFTPATTVLHPDSDGAPRQENWHYRSVIGKLNFIAANTHPDLSFAIHQCAKFSNNPRCLHEKAVKHIGRYLHLTCHQGIILCPQVDHSLNAYVDADFAGRWHQAYSHLREHNLSRTGYVLVYCGCPIAWTSKLQNEIALSTTEAEYLALSACMRDLLPLCTLIQELSANSFIDDMELSGTCVFSGHLISDVFEDNQSCLNIANSEAVCPRTKHISIKYHHFRDQVRKGIVRVVKVHTNDNWADIFTKPLSCVKFKHLRYLLMGW